MHESVIAMWDDFCRATGCGFDSEQSAISSFHFCDNQHDADECALLVLNGIKRATASSVGELAMQGLAVPSRGETHVVTNFAGIAQCVIETTAVTLICFGDITAEHAALEGEGDGSLGHWRATHTAYFRRVLKNTGIEVDDDLMIAFEEFEVVFPDVATRPSQGPGR